MAITLLKSFNLDSTGNYTFDTLTSNIKTDNLMYANGSPYVFSSNAAGSNTQVQFNNANSFGASAAFTFDSVSNSLNVTGNITAGNFVTSGSSGNISGANYIIANYFTGTLTTSSQPNITSVGTLSTVTVTSNANVGNLLTDNLLYANGSAWNLSGTYSNANVANYLPTFAGNLSAGNANITGSLSAGNANITGNIVAGNFITSGSSGNISGANYVIANYITGTLTTASQPNVTSLGTLSSLTITGNLTSGNANLGNTVSANYFIGDGSLLTGLPASYSNTNVANYLPTYTGNISAGNANITGNIIAGNANITGNIIAGNFITSGSSGNISGANYVIANYFMGDGSLLTGLPASYSNTNVANYLPTYTGNVSANYYTGNGSLLESITGGNITGQVSNALIAGTVYTNAQPNITSIGTLSSLTVTANANTGNVNTTDINASGNVLITGNLTVNGNTTYVNIETLLVEDPIIELGGGPNGSPLTTNDGKDRGTLLHYYTSTPIDAFMGWDVSNNEFSFGSNVSVSNEVVTFNSYGDLRAGTYYGNGSQLTGVTATTAQTVTTNAQPNITSIGTLSSLTVSTNITSGNVYANSGAVVASTLTGALTTASQPNITNLGSLIGLTVTGNASFSGANVSLGTVANLKILGGTANYVLKTDGAGNLNWVAQPSAVNITVDNFTGNGIQTTFTLSTTPSNVNSVLVNINGASQLREAYSLSGANLIFTSAPPDTSKIEITTLGLTASGGGGNSLATLTDVSLSSPSNGQALKYNGSVWINDTVTAYTYQAISANTTLSVGYRYLVDTSAANLTLTLPNSPSLGQEVGIIDATGTAATHEITVYGNGANIMGNSSNMTVNTSNSAFVLVYYNISRGWILTNV